VTLRASALALRTCIGKGVGADVDAGLNDVSRPSGDWSLPWDVPPDREVMGKWPHVRRIAE
jgi:hypothetical protein